MWAYIKFILHLSDVVINPVSKKDSFFSRASSWAFAMEQIGIFRIFNYLS